jgi:hypothetical protein
MTKKSSSGGSSNNRHVVPRPEGGWAVKRPGITKPESVHQRQSEAEGRAKQKVANEGGGEVRIHGRDGRIRDSDTVAPGNDPASSKDKVH